MLKTLLRTARITIGAPQVKVSVIGVALTAAAIAAGAPAHATTLYSTGFEPPDYATGQLAGQNGWFNATNAFVQTGAVDGGLQAVSVDSGTTGQYVTAQPISYDSQGNLDQLVTVSTDFLFTALDPDVTWEVLAAEGNSSFITQLLVRGSNGQACGFNPCSGPILIPDTWYQMSMQLDYSTDTVTDFINSVAFSSGAFNNIPALSTTLSAIAIGINNSIAGGNSTASWDNISVASSVVPEPATWAIMLAGFAFPGFTRTGWRKTTTKPLAT